MNRDILFRAKRVNGGKWLESMTISRGTIKRKAHDIFMEISPDKWVGIIPETVGQFTGLTDKNGNKIFEGDILKINHNSEYKNPLLCEWDSYNACFKFTDKNDYDCAYYLNQKDLSQNEITGNVFDNPKLLK